MNFARLNHILIPTTKAERDKLRKSRWVYLFAPFILWKMLSEEGRFAIVFWTITGALSLNVATTQFYILWSVLTGLLMASLAVRWRFRLRSATLTIRGPRRVTVGEEVVFEVALRNESPKDYRAIRVEGPFLPWDGKYTSPQPSFVQVVAGEVGESEVKARFFARGEHHLDPFEANALVPIGLALGPRIASLGVRFVVVPKIARVTHLTLAAENKYQLGGVALASRSTEANELVGLRPYRPGDPMRALHAKSWARMGTPMVREYQQEYFTRIGVVLDTDANDAGERAFESLLSLTAGVLAHLTRGELLVDLVVCGDEPYSLTLGRSLGFLDQALDLLAGVTPSTPLNISEMDAKLSPHVSNWSQMVYLSCTWNDPQREFVEQTEAQGVACRILQVIAKGSVSKPTVSVRFTILSADQIEKEKELVL